MERASSRCRWQAAEAEAEAAEAPGDVLLSLPTAMTDNVLGRLRFDELVLTNRLSRACRRRWESVPDLDIHFGEASATMPDDQVLWRCADPVRGFTAHVRPAHSLTPAHLERWLLALANKLVGKIALRIDDASVFLGPAIFSCGNLFHLEVHGQLRCRLDPAPHTFGGFPHLVTLVLDHVVLPFSGGGALLQHIISSAANLRLLSLIDVWFGGFYHDGVPSQETCAIQASNLRVLKLRMFHDSTRYAIAGDLPALEEAAISVVHNNLLGTPEFLDSFRRIRNAKVLSFETQPSQLTANPLEGISCQFQNLRAARLTVNFAKLPSIMLVFAVLRLARQIQKLDLKVDLFGTNRGPRYDEYDEGTDDDELGVEKLEADLSGALFGSLKQVSVDGMLYLPNDRWFVKYLLSKAGSLECFVVIFGCWGKSKSYLEGCRELKTCQKVSSQVKLTLRHRGETG